MAQINYQHIFLQRSQGHLYILSLISLNICFRNILSSPPRIPPHHTSSPHPRCVAAEWLQWVGTPLVGPEAQGLKGQGAAGDRRRHLGGRPYFSSFFTGSRAELRVSGASRSGGRQVD